MNPTITVFGSAHPKQGDEEYALAFEIGSELAKAGFTICNGGYGGIMEASARGAKSAGGHAIGVTCKAFHNRTVNAWIDTNIETYDLSDRMMKLISLGDGYVVLKGGTGTLLELAAAWEFMNKMMIAPKPIVIVGDFWRPVISTLQEALVAEGSHNAAHLVTHVNEPKQCVELLRLILENRSDR
ncbi:MAG: LOG family protein [Bacteroidetes bacterium]|nr:LOG family protein [Bacteroidota bacterium]MCW5895953.1 LOG family protein [Bacteroidota bacterium]